MAAFRAKELWFAYTPEEWILEKISLEIDSKQFVAIIGPNGGGKTTFLKLIMGLLKPTKGSLEVLEGSCKSALQRIAYVPQVLRCDRHFPLSVLELVLQGQLSRSRWWGSFRPQERKRALEALDQVGLLPYAHVAFSTLSGGQAQRALIARALASDPELLLLDEPTASVDRQTQQQIHLLLEKLKSHCTILMVTHDINTLMPYVDRVLCIQHQVTELLPDQVCRHFAIGLYHPPTQL